MKPAGTGGKSDKGLSILGRSKSPVPGSPDEAKLETFVNPKRGREYRIDFTCPEFTSICPVTGQPDFGSIAIDYIPDRLCIESKSLKLYLFAFRNHGIFHEAAVNRILDDLVGACRPRRARVTGTFNPRGGIAITVTAEYP